MSDRQGTLTRPLARQIVESVGNNGQPPIFGYQYFTAGIDKELDVLDKEYLTDFIQDGGSSFKLVVGPYGGGKTHFLFSVQGKAWEENYISSYITLSPNSTPFHKLELVYREIVQNLIYPQSSESLIESYERGIEALLKIWYYRKIENLADLTEEQQKLEINEYLRRLGPFDSTSFKNAITGAFKALADDDDESFALIIQWLTGENPPKTELKRFQIFEKIDKSNAFKMLKCVIRFIREVDYAGLIILMDEAEQTPSMSSKERDLLLNNLRELVDMCSNGRIPSTMLFYAVPNLGFLEGRTGVYEALNQRLATVFDACKNPTGVRIELEKTGTDPIGMLVEIGQKLSFIYEIAYSVTFDPQIMSNRINEEAAAAEEERFGDIGMRRNFVQKMIAALHDMKNEQMTAK